MLCCACTTNRIVQTPTPSIERVCTENSPKGERPRLWAMAGHSSSKKQTATRAGILAFITTSGLPPPYGQVRQSKKWLRLTGQPKPSRVPTKVDAPNVGATRTRSACRTIPGIVAESPRANGNVLYARKMKKRPDKGRFFDYPGTSRAKRSEFRTGPASARHHHARRCRQRLPATPGQARSHGPHQP